MRGLKYYANRLIWRLWAGDEPPPRGPADDFWYGDAPAAPASSAGQSVTADSAMQIATVYRAVDLLANSVALLPLHVYRRLENGGKERAKDHPLQGVLRRPNPWQTGFEFRRLVMAHRLLRGNAYILVRPSESGYPVGALMPLDPSQMVVEQLPSRRRRYTYTWINGQKQVFTQDEICHLTALSTNGVVGVAPVTLARQTMGTALALSDFTARQFTQSPKLSGVLSTPHELDDEAHKRIEESFRRNWSGQSGWHGVPLLEQDLKFQQVGMSNHDAEFVASRKFTRTEIATWFGVPPHMVGDLERATFSNIEHQGVDLVTYSLLPHLVNIEQRFWVDLLIEDEDHFVEHVVDALLRGDGVARATRQEIYLRNGVLNPDEVRAQENWNPRADGRGGVYLESVNAARPIDRAPPPKE